MSACVMCKGEGRIPQRGEENSGAREVCPTCNGTGVMPEGQTEATHVFNAPQAATPPNSQPVQPVQEEDPKADGAASDTGSSSDSESGADETEVNGPKE